VIILKGEPKRVTPVNFWPRNAEKVPSIVKELIFSQYYSKDTMYVYCDMSMKPGFSTMSVACSYVKEGSVLIKHKYVHPPKESYDKNIYGELKAIIFALSHFEKYIGKCTSMILYSDVNEIERIVSREITFKHNFSLKEVQNELILLYKKIISQYPGKVIRISYLPEVLRKYNPFHKSAHNAAKKLLK
jgi:hypothetical protein